jgi:hypothetical protein
MGLGWPTAELSKPPGMNEKLEAAKRFLGNRYVLRKDYKPVERHRLGHRVNTLETIREVRERIRQGPT